MAGSVSVGRATVAEIRQAASHLIDAHWRETERHREAMPLDVDWAHYEALETAGALIAFAARCGDEVVGYASASLIPHPHHGGRLVCSVDALYVTPRHRGTGLGMGLLTGIEVAASAAGARVLTAHAKPCSQATICLRQLGMEQLEVVYSKEL